MNMKTMFRWRLLLAGAFALLLTGCVGAPTARLGMVKDPDSGLMFGSAVESSLVTDAAFYPNRKIKIRVRNTSGDTAFDLKGFTGQLKSAYAASGFEPTDGNDFGLLMDINVRFSGQIQTNLAQEYGFLGGAAGGVGGMAHYKTNTGMVGGAVAGATIGSILGSFVTDDTYIIIVSTTFGIREKAYGKTGKTITFSRSTTKKDEDEDQADGFRKTFPNQISAYAGGRMTSQAEIAGQVRSRLVRILGDMI
ncbi:MAG: complement resistance protein TraT [Rhodospirillales bacterium]|nr:complement resistance protein TraT [Rhodospirillales bacterium]